MSLHLYRHHPVHLLPATSPVSPIPLTSLPSTTLAMRFRAHTHRLHMAGERNLASAPVSNSPGASRREPGGRMSM
jgi:hypothetical protein